MIWVSDLRILSLGLLCICVLVGLDFWLWLVRFRQWWRLFVHSFDFLWKVVIVVEGCWWVSIFGCGCGFPVHSFGFFCVAVGGVDGSGICVCCWWW